MVPKLCSRDDAHSQSRWYLSLLPDLPCCHGLGQTQKGSTGSLLTCMTVVRKSENSAPSVGLRWLQARACAGLLRGQQPGGLLPSLAPGHGDPPTPWSQGGRRRLLVTLRFTVDKRSVLSLGHSLPDPAPCEGLRQKETEALPRSFLSLSQVGKQLGIWGSPWDLGSHEGRFLKALLLKEWFPGQTAQCLMGACRNAEPQPFPRCAK